MKPILVTGGTGFLGSHLVDELVARGERVRVLVRLTSSLENIIGHVKRGNVEVVEGNLLDPESLKRACSGAEMIFNVAAAVDFSLPGKLFESVNVHALMNFVELAGEAGINCFVHVSTVGFYGWNGRPIDEKTQQYPTNIYEESKLRGEKVLLDAYRDVGFPVAIIEPSFIYGPRARVGIPAIFWTVQKRWMPLIDGENHRSNMVYVSDVVDAMILASEKEEAMGECFVIGHEVSSTYREILDIVAEVLGVRTPRWSVPYAVAKPVAAILEKGARFLGFHPLPLSKYLDYTVLDCLLDIGKARRVLGYCPKVGLKEGMERTVAWFREYTDLIRQEESLPVRSVLQVD